MEKCNHDILKSHVTFLGFTQPSTAEKMIQNEYGIENGFPFR